MRLELIDLLLHDRYSPITTSIGFFEATCENSVRVFSSWQEKLKTEFNIIKLINISLVKGDIEQCLRKILPFKSRTPNRFLFLPTQGRWTAYVDNLFHGTDPTVISYLPERLTSRSVWVVAQPQGKKPVEGYVQKRPGALIMEVYGHEQTQWLNVIRKIRLENESGKWKFEQFGNPFPFEQTERYNAKRKTDRFDFPMLKQYLWDLGGLRPFDEDFYLPPEKGSAILVEITTKGDSKDKEISLKEARHLNLIE
ncbi:MAG: hypothetical protein AB9891_12635 [Anaerolineaceae bacterium]